MPEINPRSICANVVGIDLGVTHCYAARLSTSGEPILIRNREGEQATRSAIWFEEQGKVVIGTEAWKMRGVRDYVFLEFLRDLGQGVSHPTPAGPFSPSDFCALTLKKITEEFIENNGGIDALAITVPANFTDWARSDIRRAAIMAGLHDVSLVDQSTALALSVFRQHQLKDGTYLVLSSGSNSTNAFAIKVFGTDVSILSSSGIARLGFKDFRDKFVELVIKKHALLTGKTLSAGEILTECQLTDWDIEQSVQTLGCKDKISLPLRTDHGYLRCEISREEFTDAVRPLTVQIELVLDSVFDSADLATGQLSNSFLQAEPEIYGHLAQIVKSLTGAYPSEMPEGSAAIGATIYAATSAGIKSLTNAQRVGIPPIRIQDIAPSFLGMLEMDWLTGKRRKRVVIPKGEPLPACRSYSLNADESGQLPEITLTESGSEQEDPDFVNYIKTLKASRARPGSRHRLNIGFDQNGCAYVTLKSSDDEDDYSSHMESAPPRR